MAGRPTGRDDSRCARPVIVIDPGMAFGTGQHPTTRMCLAAVQRYVTRGVRVLDVGTGSGVLAMAAARLGAGRVTAVDVADEAVAAARRNAAANRMAIDVRRGSLDTAGPRSGRDMWPLSDYASFLRALS